MSLLGPEGINARVASIQSRIDALTLREAPRFDDQLAAATGPRPLNPFGGGGEISGPIGLQPLVQAAAQKAGIEPELLSAVVDQESGGNPRAVSHAGAQGLCQLMPDTARGLGVEDPFDPAQSLDGGARYLRQMLDENGGDRVRALAAYNAGPGRVRGKGYAQWPRETQHYVTSIMARMRNG